MKTYLQLHYVIELAGYGSVIISSVISLIFHYVVPSFCYLASLDSY